MTEAHAARGVTANSVGSDRPRAVHPGWTLVWAAVCLVAFAVAWWFLVPRQPAGTLELGPIDPTGRVDAKDLDRIHLYGAWARPFEAATIVLPVATVLMLGLSRMGVRLASRIGAGMRLQSLRSLLVAFAVVGIVWAMTLPAEAALQVVYEAAGSLGGGWGEWAADRLVQLVEWWALASVAVLLIRVTSRYLRGSWWWVLTVAVAVLVLAGTVLSGRWTVSDTDYPSLPDGELRTHVLALADQIGVGVTDVQVVPETPSTTTYNAYVTGVGDDHVVVLYETLLRRSTPDEVSVVAAHELGHVHAHDSERRALLASLAAALATALVGAAASSRRVRRWAGTDGVRVSDAPAVPMLVALTVAAGVLVVPALDTASRALELRADLTALDVTDDPAALRVVVARSAALYLHEPDPALPWRLLSGHPSPGERIALADAWEARHH